MIYHPNAQYDPSFADNDGPAYLVQPEQTNPPSSAGLPFVTDDLRTDCGDGLEECDALSVGESTTFGGGAAPFVTITRIR